MMFLRSFARPVLLVWLLAFALLLAGPTSVFATVQNRVDGVEGDPGDGVESIGSGGGGRDINDKAVSGSSLEVDRFHVIVEFLIVYIPGHEFVIRIIPGFSGFNDYQGSEE